MRSTRHSKLSLKAVIPALSVATDPFFDTRRDKLVDLAVRYAVPVMYQFREFAVAGGLMSYGADTSNAYNLVGVYAGRISTARSQPTCRFSSPRN